MEKSKFERVISVLSKLLLPVAIALFGYYQFLSTTEFQKSQNSLARELEKSTKERETQLKLFEMVWQSLNEPDIQKKMLAVKLLKSLNEDYAKIISTTIGQDNSQPIIVRAEANQYFIDHYLDFLNNYKIEIFFIDIKKEKIAKTIKRLIDSKKIGAHTTITFMNSELLKKLRPPKSDEIRYDKEIEDIEVNSLAALLNINFINMNFKLRPVANSSPTVNYISVFII